ncbi:FAD-dependent oxidoreductase [Chloroflexota bacterium]
MELNIAGVPEVSTTSGVAIIGDSAAAIQAALTLAQMGVEVKLITSSPALGGSTTATEVSGGSTPDRCYLWPLLLRVSGHPLITLYSNASVEAIGGQKGDFKVQVAQYPRFINEDLCTSCGRCQDECSVKINSSLDGKNFTRHAIHAPLPEDKSVPSAYVINKNGVSPCRVACPLGINVQGFVSLLANGKTDQALALINEAAPLARILGRVCKHPCENECHRTEVDQPLFIQALHRYAADNALGKIEYSRKAPAGSRLEKIAIVGSGPAGLAAAWELTRRGYTPTVFESHGVIGGMLATGIPRFRLPREVRERDIEAILSLGVDIRTGITVGRDVTLSYLRERGYRAFFLSIGCQQNNRLNIPGEELEGVVDCMSILLTLNLRVDTFVGSNIVIIGDGNSAIDSARAAIRRNGGRAKILSWTIPEEITAVEEEVKETLQEGISIEYCTVPVEILGDEAGKVTGIRCQRTKLTDEIMPNGRHRPEAIPGTDFMIDADHVVVAVGQSPDTLQLHLPGLAVGDDTGAVKVNPLTLETSLRGVFAGGDCITGPNNVVEAMASGLRAAESVDRYLQEYNLEDGRSLERPVIAEVDLDKVEISPYPRAAMPVIGPRKRINSFEETTKGLSVDAAQMEAQRCLNCALCSQCLECVRVCELDAISHDDSARRFEILAQAVLRFPTEEEEREAAVEGVTVIPSGNHGELSRRLAGAMAVALETAIEVKPVRTPEGRDGDLVSPDTETASLTTDTERPAGGKRIGVFLCHCGGSISSIVDFRAVTRRLSDIPGVLSIREIAQACTEVGAEQIADEVAEWQLDTAVVAACRCCNLEQVCYSCTDRRQMCQQYLEQHPAFPSQTAVEFVNIREQCAWVHADDPRGATRKAAQIVSSGVARARLASPPTAEKRAILPVALIVGDSLAAVAAARALLSRSYRVTLVTSQSEELGKSAFSSELPEGADFTLKAWPGALNLQGAPGSYEVELEYGAQVDKVTAGALLVDMEVLFRDGAPKLKITPEGSLLSRLISRRISSDFGIVDDLQREVTILETAGLFWLTSDGAGSADESVLRGLAAAARVATFLERADVSPRITSVNINAGLCRGCGNCSEVCSYIEMREREDGTVYACIDRTMCLGCGVCLAGCPTGAITQGQQSDRQITSTLRSLLRPSQVLSEV